MVHLQPDIVALLDARAERDGVSRSALVRRAIDELLADEQSEAVASRYREAYRIAPSDTHDDWGDIEAWHVALSEARSSDGPELSWR